MNYMKEAKGMIILSNDYYHDDRLPSSSSLTPFDAFALFSCPSRCIGIKGMPCPTSASSSCNHIIEDHNTCLLK